MSRTTAVLLAGLILGASATAALTDEGAEAAKARQTFESLFGEEVAKVRGTPTAQDDLALAKRLLEVARDATDSPAFLAVLCDHAYALASPHASGKDTAVAAMDLLAEHVPNRAEEAQARVRQLREGKDEAGAGGTETVGRPTESPQGAPEDKLKALLAEIEKKKQAGALVEAAALYRKAKGMAKAAGDNRLGEIEAAAEALTRRIRLERRTRDVRAMLKNQPDNVSAREGLVRLYLVKLDDPERAAEVLEGVEDEELKKYVPAAAKPVDAAPELACLDLGEWYKGLAESAPDDAKPAMYARAKAYLDRFLRLHATKDMDRVRAKVAMEKVGKALAKGEAPAAAPAQPAKPKKPDETAGGKEKSVIKPGKWVDLIRVIDPAKHVVAGQGEWIREGKVLRKVPGRTMRSRIMIPYKIRGSYQLHTEYVFSKPGAGFGPGGGFGFTLPVGERSVHLCLWAKSEPGTHGLGFVDHHYADNNETTVPAQPVVVNRPYSLDVQVEQMRRDQAHIAVRLNGKPIIDWTGRRSALDTYNTWRLPERGVLGLHEGHAVEYRVICLKMLSGEARLLRAKNAKDSDHGYVTTWLLAGPYTGGSPFETAYPPEKKDADVTWRVPDKGVGPQIIDLGKVFGGDHRAAYAKAYLYSPKEQEVRLELGSDDGIKVWVNDECVHANDVTRSVQPGEDKAMARLHRGWNRVLVKIAQNIYTWGFSFRVTEPDGSPFEGMKVRMEKP